MSAMIDAVYQGGVFRPATPPEIPEGTAVRLTVVVPATPTPPDGRRAYELLRAIAEMPMEPGGDPTVTSETVDQTLYSAPNGAR